MTGSVGHVYFKTFTFEKNFTTPFYGWGSTVSRLQSQYEETVYFLLVILQELLAISRIKGQYIMSYFYKPFRFLYKKFGKFSLKAVYVIMLRKIFKFMVFRLPGKYIFDSKNYSYHQAQT